MGAAVQLEAFTDEEAPAGVPPPSKLPPEVQAILDQADSETAPEADDFSWSGEDVVVAEQRAVAVYRNRFGGIVIREQSAAGDDEDHFVVLRDNDAAKHLIAALQRQIGGRVR